MLLTVLSLLASLPALAADLPGPWVQLASDGGLDVRSVIAPGMDCPKVVADGKLLTSRTRGKPDDDFPVQVCIARTVGLVSSITVDRQPAPTLATTVKRVVVIGDTGCRLKGDFVQACNDPVQWPFATVARLAATRRPDLIIHVGDYHYRESKCPTDKPGCSGSPSGDNWPVWQKDFFNPAAPLLAAAPWVLVRGNHELCNRGGKGWFRLLDPHADIDDCTDTTEPYALRVGPLSLLLFDGADADDTKADPAKVAFYQKQLQPLLAAAPPHSWLLTHRPVWALAQGPGTKPGDALNATEQAALRDLPLSALDLVLSGHVHNFMSYDFGPSRPAQLVVGEGGDLNDDITQPLDKDVAIDGAKIRRGLGIPNYGYVVLQRVNQGWTGLVYSVSDQLLARCRLEGRSIVCRRTAV